MTESTRRSSGWGWMVGILLLVAALAALLIGFFSLRMTNRVAEADLHMTPVSGGVTMPTATPTPVQLVTRIGAGGEAQLLPGQRVAVISPDGSGTRLLAEATLSGLVMDVYKDGATFVVVEPDGETGAYPVERDGRAWVRVRAGDGLVGWVAVERLVLLE